MTDERRCPKCGAKNTAGPKDPPRKYKCGTVWVGEPDNDIIQTDKCRIAELEAENERLTRQLEVREAKWIETVRFHLENETAAAQMADEHNNDDDDLDLPTDVRGIEVCKCILQTMGVKERSEV